MSVENKSKAKIVHKNSRTCESEKCCHLYPIFIFKTESNPFFLSKKVKKSSNASGGPTPQICEQCGQVLVKNHQCQEKDALITCSICQKQMSTKSYRAHLQYHRHSIYIRTASSKLLYRFVTFDSLLAGLVKN